MRPVRCSITARRGARAAAAEPLDDFARRPTLRDNGPRVHVARVIRSGRTTEIYDPATGGWWKTGDLEQVRDYFRGLFTLPNGKALIAGGQDGCGCVAYATAELYYPTSGTWSWTSPLNTARRSVMTVQLADGRVLYATGATGGPAPRPLPL